MVRDITGCRVSVVGKPSLQALRAAASDLAVPIAMVGDDPELEMPMAHKGGALAVAVHTGIGYTQSFADLPEKIRPHLGLPDAGVLAGLLK